MNKNDVEAIYPLSPMQHGMLFHMLAAPQSGEYLQQFICTLHGNLNFAAFERAWQQVVNNHPILRTLFAWKCLDEPLQVVLRHMLLSWQQYDWCKVSPEEQQGLLNAFLESDRSQGINLRRAPLMRLSLIKMAQDVHQFVWTHPHLLLDGWSVSLLLSEILTAYDACCKGNDIVLEQHRPFKDYITWLAQQDLSQAESFWRKTLQGFTVPTRLELGSSYIREPFQEDLYGTQQIQLSARETSALQSFARLWRVTLNTLVQGSWALLLSAFSGTDDIIFGATVSGRPADLTGVESMVGLFINTLPVRVHVLPDDLLTPWLQDLFIQQVEARQYEYSPLVLIRCWSDVPRGMPLFESILVFENFPVEATLGLPSNGLHIANDRAIERMGYPLHVVILPGAQLTIQINYDRRCFSEESITHMLQELYQLLRRMVANPERCLSDLLHSITIERQEQRALASSVLSLEGNSGRTTKLVIAPRDTMELKLTQILEEILDTHSTSITDNFFDLGGHSLLALRFVEQIRKQLGHDLPLATLFQGPTIAKIADYLRREGSLLDR